MHPKVRIPFRCWRGASSGLPSSFSKPSCCRIAFDLLFDRLSSFCSLHQLSSFTRDPSGKNNGTSAGLMLDTFTNSSAASVSRLSESSTSGLLTNQRRCSPSTTARPQASSHIGDQGTEGRFPPPFTCRASRTCLAQTIGSSTARAGDPGVACNDHRGFLCSSAQASHSGLIGLIFPTT